MATFNQTVIVQNNVILKLLKIIAREAIGDQGAFDDDFIKEMTFAEELAQIWIAQSRVDD